MFLSRVKGHVSFIRSLTHSPVFPPRSRACACVDAFQLQRAAVSFRTESSTPRRCLRQLSRGGKTKRGLISSARPPDHGSRGVYVITVPSANHSAGPYLDTLGNLSGVGGAHLYIVYAPPTLTQLGFDYGVTWASANT